MLHWNDGREMCGVIGQEERSGVAVGGVTFDRKIDPSEGDRSESISIRVFEDRISNDDDRTTENVSKNEDVQLLETFVEDLGLTVHVFRITRQTEDTGNIQ